MPGITVASHLGGEFVLFACYQDKVVWTDSVAKCTWYFQVWVFWGDDVGSQAQLPCARALEVSSF